MKCEQESVEAIGILGFWQLYENKHVVSPITVEERPSNYNMNDSYEFTANNIIMRQLSGNNDIQYKEDLFKLLKLLKSKYPFHDEMNKDVLYDDEIERFSVLYGITNVCPVLACHNSMFWLKDPDGVIYMWSCTDDMMIRGGNNMKEALINFLFQQENLCYVNEYTHELLPIKEVDNEIEKWYEENKKTAVETMVIDELKPLEEKRKDKKGGKQKK